MDKNVVMLSSAWAVFAAAMRLVVMIHVPQPQTIVIVLVVQAFCVSIQPKVVNALVKTAPNLGLLAGK